MGSQQLTNELEDRLLDFAVRIIKLAGSMPRSQAGKHVANQLLRCGTSRRRTMLRLARRKAPQTFSTS